MYMAIGQPCKIRDEQTHNHQQPCYYGATTYYLQSLTSLWDENIGKILAFKSLPNWFNAERSKILLHFLGKNLSFTKAKCKQDSHFLNSKVVTITLVLFSKYFVYVVANNNNRLIVASTQTFSCFEWVVSLSLFCHFFIAMETCTHLKPKSKVII